MPRVTMQEIAQRRTKVVYLLLTGVPRTEIPERLGLSRKMVARDVAAVAKAIEHQSGTNRDAVEETIGALQDAGRLERVDRAKVAALRSIANQLDLEASNSMMWRVYWDALEALADDADDDGDTARLLAWLSSDSRDEATPGA